MTVINLCTASALHVLSSLFTVTTVWGDILWRILPLTEPEPEPELDLLGKSFKYTSCEIFGFNGYEIMTFCCCECIKCAIILFTRVEICWWCHRHMMVVSCIDWCSYYCSYFSSSFSLPAGLPRSGKLPVLFLLSSQKSTFWPLAEKLWITSKNGWHLLWWAWRALSPCKFWGRSYNARRL